MYDKDNSGSIELAEMIEIIGTLYEMEGVSKVLLYIRIDIKWGKHMEDSKIHTEFTSRIVELFINYSGKCSRKGSKNLW